MKTKRQKKILVAVLMFTLTTMYIFLPPVFNAGAVDSIKDASDTISDSDLGETATHTFLFTTATTSAGGYWDFDFPDSPTFTGLATTSITCAYGDANLTEYLFEATNVVRCLAAAQQDATTTRVVVTGVVSPSTDGEQFITITRYDDAGVAQQRISVAVYIIEDVLMTATVQSTLEFSITGTTTDAAVNGVDCDEVTTATTTPFGTLEVGTAKTICQDLYVTTNADDGYIVTVEQDGEMTSDSGSNINSFNNSQDGTGTTTPEAWDLPDNILDNYHTYGHMGLTSNDDDLVTWGYNDYYQGAAYYVGLNGTDPVVIMHHDGPSDGETQNMGYASVAYTAEIASLQEAGDYESTLTYICTPTY